jgi:hypothetical protein
MVAAAVGTIVLWPLPCFAAAVDADLIPPQVIAKVVGRTA